MNDDEIVLKKDEFRRVIKIFAEHQMLKQIWENLTYEVGVLNRIVEDKDTIITRQKRTIEILEEEKKLIEPVWYDKFWVGASATILAIIGLVCAF